MIHRFSPQIIQISQITCSPASLEEMVEAGYLGDVPIDPITHSDQTWLVETEDFPLSGQESIVGVVDVHSGSDQTSLDGTQYSSW